jgi:hypothetical protein
MLITLMLLPFILSMGNPEVPMLQALPDELQGWRSDGPVRTYDRKTIFNYIDGGGEIYLAYGFTQVSVRSYEKAGNPSIEIALFDMGDSRDAYGIYTYELEKENASVGQGGEYMAGMLRFWKGRYFVCVMAEKDTPPAKDAVMAFGMRIAEMIENSGSMPGILDYLPKEGLVSRRFFHTADSLNRLYFIANQNILSLSRETDAVLARYGSNSPPWYLLLVQYSNEEDAESAFGIFKKAYIPDAAPGAPVKCENGCWTGGALQGRCIFIVLDAPSKSDAERMMKEVHDGLKGS